MTWQYSPPKTEHASDATYRAATHWTLYMKVGPDERHAIARHEGTAYAAHNMLGRVRPGDVLWLVNISAGRLFLLGRLAVEFVVDDTTIAQELTDTSQAWREADWYAIANRYNVEAMREVEITNLAGQLIFISTDAQHLTVRDGVLMKPQELTHLRRLDPSSASMIEAAWYDDALVLQSAADFLEIVEDDEAYSEGKQVIRTVKQRQRSRALVQRAKERFRQQHDGRLFCEVCGFDFDAVYGVEYIEAHHKEPVSALDEELPQTADALVMLCANCHRMAHTQTPPLSVDALKQLLQK